MYNKTSRGDNNAEGGANQAGSANKGNGESEGGSKEPNIIAKGLQTMQNASTKAGTMMGELTGALGFTGGMPASRHFDITLGIDIHPLKSPAPIPTPSPWIGIVFDPLEYLSDLCSLIGGDKVGESKVLSFVSALGGSIKVNGLHKTMAGSESFNIPHFLWLAPNDGEVFMGSSTVLVEGEPFTYAALPVLDCWIAGFPAPFRPKPRRTFNPLNLPTSFVIPLPHGNPVIVGGPPTISFMQLAFKALFKFFGKGLQALLRKFPKKLVKCAPCLTGKIMMVLANPATMALISNPVDASTGKSVKADDDFSLPGTMELTFTRVHSGGEFTDGLLGKGWFDPWSEYLIFNKGNIDFHTANARTVKFDDPFTIGTEATNISAPQNRLRREGRDYLMYNNNQGVTKRFTPFDDGRYRLISIEDQNGNSIEFRYLRPTEDRPVYAISRVLHSDGYEIDVLTDHAGRAVSLSLVTTGGNKQNLVKYAYDEEGMLITVQKPNGYVERYEYNDKNLMSRIIYNDEYWTDYIYDEDDRVVETKSSTEYYNDQLIIEQDSGQTVYIDSLERQHRYEFDDRDLPTLYIDPAGNETRKEWGPADELLSDTDALGRKVSYTYDSLAQITSVIYPDESKESFDRDDKGRLTGYTDQAGRSWTLAYDDRDNLITETWPDGRKVEYIRRDDGQVSKIIRPNGSETLFEYNRRNRLSAIVEWNGARSEFEYNEAGRLTCRTDALGGVTEFGYDLGGNLTSAKLADGRVMSWAYDAFGNQTSFTDAEGRTSTYEYGPYNTIEKMVDPLGENIRFERDKVQRLKAVYNEAGEKYRFDYDPADNLLKEIDFSGRELSYSYDAEGQLVQSVAGDGRKTSFTHDIMGRVTQQEIEPLNADEKSLLTDFIYNDKGDLEEVLRDDIRLAFKRDDMGQLEEERLQVLADGEILREDLVTHSYDADGNRIKRDFNGHVTEYDYDVDGLMTRFALDGHDPLTFQRDILGREIMRHSGAGFVQTFDFDKVGQLVGQAAGHAGDEFMAMRGPDSPWAKSIWRPDGSGQSGMSEFSAGLTVERKYRYDKAFNPVEIADNRWGSMRYSYDQRDQVISASYENRLGTSLVEERFTYDKTRNISHSESVFAQSSGESRAVAAAQRYSPGGRIERRGDTTYAYDAEGRLISKRQDKKGFRPQTWKYSWDGENQLRTVTTPDGGVWAYNYDPFGRRIGKVCMKGGKARQPAKVAYLWDGNQLSGERRIYADGTQSSVDYHYEEGSFVPLAQVTDQSLHYIVTDQIGTPRELFDETGALSWSQRHRLWGEKDRLWPLEAANDNIRCDLRFQGQIEDEESGLYYNRFRYYDREGGYVSSDPIGLNGGFRTNSYVERPNGWVDPLGLVEKGELCSDDLQVNRSGGGEKAKDWKLSRLEKGLDKPGASMISGTANEAAAEMRGHPTFKGNTDIQGTAKVSDIRAAGFDVIHWPTRDLPNHVRIIHPDGADGFNLENRQKLAEKFKNIPTPDEPKC